MYGFLLLLCYIPCAGILLAYTVFKILFLPLPCQVISSNRYKVIQKAQLIKYHLQHSRLRII